MDDAQKAEQLAREIEGWVACDDLVHEMRDALAWLLRQYARGQKESPRPVKDGG